MSSNGTVHNLVAVDEKIKELKEIWLNIKNSLSSKSQITLMLMTKFLLKALDELVSLVDNLIDKGPDKKATVLGALEKIYEFIVKEGLPIWMIPFAMPLKNYIIYIIASALIDWAVEKYKNGSWRKNKEIL